MSHSPSRSYSPLTFLRGALLVSGFGLAILAAFVTGSDTASEDQMLALETITERTDGKPAVPDTDDTKTKAGNGSQTRSPDDVGWLTIDGTAIDYPIVQSGEGTPSDWYLSHDYWGSPSLHGHPFLDTRSRLDGQHLLIYGHRVGTTEKMFTQISSSHEPDRFMSIGSATWTGNDQVPSMFLPLCSLKVDETYAAIQTFTFDGVEGLRRWLSALAERSNAQAPNARRLIEKSVRALTLVTCSSAVPNGPERTLMIFVASYG